MSKISLNYLSSPNTISDLDFSAQRQLIGGNVILPPDAQNNLIVRQNGTTSLHIDEESRPGFLLFIVGDLEIPIQIL